MQLSCIIFLITTATAISYTLNFVDRNNFFTKIENKFDEKSLLSDKN